MQRTSKAQKHEITKVDQRGMNIGGHNRVADKKIQGITETYNFVSTLFESLPP